MLQPEAWPESMLAQVQACLAEALRLAGPVLRVGHWDLVDRAGLDA